MYRLHRVHVASPWSKHWWNLGDLAHGGPDGVPAPFPRLPAKREPQPAGLLEPTDPRALLDGYVATFGRSHAGLPEQVLRSDATLEATPFRDWRDTAGAVRADGVVVLAPTATGVSLVVKFHEPALATTFGHPDVTAN
jgi:hypothetical protein